MLVKVDTAIYSCNTVVSVVVFWKIYHAKYFARIVVGWDMILRTLSLFLHLVMRNTNLNNKDCFDSYRPDFVMIISVPRPWNLLQSSRPSNVILMFLSRCSRCVGGSIRLGSWLPMWNPPNCWLWPAIETRVTKKSKTSTRVTKKSNTKCKLITNCIAGGHRLLRSNTTQYWTQQCRYRGKITCIGRFGTHIGHTT